MRKKKNIVLQNILIEDYAAEGKSLARQEGKVIFVEGVVPGDRVDVRLTKSKKDWAEGTPLNFQSYSTDRVEPFCRHFGVCGGCQWQMLPYSKQLQFKQKQVSDNLKRIGKVALPDMLPIVGAAEDKYYRNKLEYTFSTKEFIPAQDFRKMKEEEVLPSEQGLSEKALGFHAKGFFDKVVHIEKCWLQPEPTNLIRNAVRQYAYENNLSFYDIRNHVGFLRTMQVRI
ncbi:MAG: class I SAM-dependent RNA methyltransferase [Chitinophagaceae bacterium]